jgi:predicted HTH transcriptional regulator
VSSYLKKLIAQGEHQQLDFKFEISDSKKIARSLSAFANTDGGRLLIGVKDNGHIAGIRSEEEYYMLEAASQMYCKPNISLENIKWRENGMAVLEVIVPKGQSGNIYYAPDVNNNWKAYIRVGDQNLLANSVLLKVWKKKVKDKGTIIKYSDKEKWLMEYLNKNQAITFSKFCKLAKIPWFKAERILVNLVYFDIIDIDFTGQFVVYKLKAQ